VSFGPSATRAQAPRTAKAANRVLIEARLHHGRVDVLPTATLRGMGHHFDAVVVEWQYVAVAVAARILLLPGTHHGEIGSSGGDTSKALMQGVPIQAHFGKDVSCRLPHVHLAPRAQRPLQQYKLSVQNMPVAKRAQGCVEGTKRARPKCEQSSWLLCLQRSCLRPRAARNQLVTATMH
jgi:hypothetical protein